MFCVVKAKKGPGMPIVADGSPTEFCKTLGVPKAVLVNGETLPPPPNALKLAVCIVDGTLLLPTLLLPMCFVGLCVFNAFIDGAGTFDLFNLLFNKLSRSIFRSPVFKFSDQVAPTFCATTVVEVFIVAHKACGCSCMLPALTGWSRLLLLLLEIGGNTLSEKYKFDGKINS